MHVQKSQTDERVSNGDYIYRRPLSRSSSLTLIYPSQLSHPHSGLLVRVESQLCLDNNPVKIDIRTAIRCSPPDDRVSLPTYSPNNLVDLTGCLFQ